MKLIERLIRPSKTAFAHCDGPCGVYDPASARIAAEAVLSMEKKMAALGDSEADRHTKIRYTEIKEQQAELVKHDLDVLWHDYFKPDHLSAVPNLHEMFWNATKLASKNKVENNPANGEALLKAVEEIHNAFWKTKNREVAFYLANP